MLCYCVYCFFFFKQKTAYELRISDWSSDVCSSDLIMCKVDFGKVGRRVDGGMMKIDGERQRKAVVGFKTGPFLVIALALGNFDGFQDPQEFLGEIGSASCRERVCQYV